MARVNDQYIFKAFMTAAAAAYGTCSFYPADWEPDITSVNRWAAVSMVISDEPTRQTDHLASGRFTMTINARKSLNDVYAARKIANTMTNTFKNGGFSVTASSTPVGMLRTMDSTSQQLGLSDGIMSHYWECDFIVYEVISGD